MFCGARKSRLTIIKFLAKRSASVWVFKSSIDLSAPENNLVHLRNEFLLLNKETMLKVITTKKISTKILNKTGLSCVDKAATKIMSMIATLVLEVFFKCSNISHSFS